MPARVCEKLNCEAMFYVMLCAGACQWSKCSKCRQSCCFYVAATCVSGDPNLESVCGQIPFNADLLTMFSEFCCLCLYVCLC